MNVANSYRHWIEHCHALAERASSRDSRARLLMLAEHWEACAAREEAAEQLSIQLADHYEEHVIKQQRCTKRTDKREANMGKAKQLVGEIIGDGKLFEEGKRQDNNDRHNNGQDDNDNAASKRPGPFAQDLSRRPPGRKDRDDDYLPEKRVTGNAAKRR